MMMDTQENHAVSHYNISQESFRSENKDKGEGEGEGREALI